MKKFITLIAMLAIAGTVSAALVEGDIILLYAHGNPTADGTDAVEYDSQTWNKFDYKDAVDGDLMKVGGGDSDATITATVAGAGSKTGGQNGVLPTNLSWVTANAPDDRIGYAAYGGSMSFTISGLNTSFTYKISFAAEMDNGAYDGQTNTVNGVSQAYNPRTHGSVYENVWENVALNASDQIVVEMTGEPGERPVLGMVRIEVVPEPATVGMLGLGALVALLVRRIRA